MLASTMRKLGATTAQVFGELPVAETRKNIS